MIKFFTKLNFVIVELQKKDIFLISLENRTERNFFLVKRVFAHFDLEFYMYVALLIKKKKCKN